LEQGGFPWDGMRKRNKVVLIACVAAVFTVLAERGATGILHTERSLYRNIVIEEKRGVRCMKFGRFASARQTCMSLDEPEKLVFDYTRMMLGALYLNPDPARVLIIGLGGGTLPTTLRKMFSASSIDIVEIDPAVIRVAKTYFGFSPDPSMRVMETDGRVFVKRALLEGLEYDLIMLDAFDHEYIPEHLLTREFLLEVQSLLAEAGVLAANTHSRSRLRVHESATYYDVFGTFYNLKRANRVILARKGGIPEMDEIQRNADRVEEYFQSFGTGKDWLIPLFSTEKDWPAGARVLTDQFAPVNVLNES